MRKTALVTVGSTKFDALVQAVDDDRIVEALAAIDYGELVIQKGKGEYQLKNLLSLGESQRTLKNGFTIKCFEYVPSIADLIEKASLIICHAGAGSVFEGLQARKTLIVVPNAALMHNHQVELAQRLEQMGHLISATPDALVTKLQSVSSFQAVPYEPHEPSQIVERIDELFLREHA